MFRFATNVFFKFFGPQCSWKWPYVVYIVGQILPTDAKHVNRMLKVYSCNLVIYGTYTSNTVYYIVRISELWRENREQIDSVFSKNRVNLIFSKLYSYDTMNKILFLTSYLLYTRRRFWKKRLWTKKNGVLINYIKDVHESLSGEYGSITATNMGYNIKKIKYTMSRGNDEHQLK